MTTALRGLGFDVTEMIDAGGTDLRGAIGNFRQACRRARTVGLFYYSGYAAQSRRGELSAAVGFRPATGHIAAADVGATGIPLTELLGGQEGGGLRIVLLDSRRRHPA